jgi:four helix bundle suffix protein
MLLTNVARASLSDELLKDYKSFLIQRGLRVWPKDSPEAMAMRERLKHDVVSGLPPAREGVVRLTGLTGLTEFIAQTDAEIAGNAMLCAVNQAAYLLRRQVEQQGRDFVAQGGFTERLYAARVKARAEKEPAAPACPVCGKEMRKRTAGKGPHAGKSFWGCSGYPECKGCLSLSDESDLSDK